jgi:hypothetical protein
MVVWCLRVGYGKIRLSRKFRLWQKSQSGKARFDEVVKKWANGLQ